MSITAILKKSLQLMRTKKRFKLQSKKYYAKFLYDRAYSAMPVSIRLLIDKIYKRLCVNHTFLNYQIDFDILKNAGIFNEKPIYRIKVTDNKKAIEKTITALIQVYKYVEFRTIFLFDKEDKNNSIKDMIFQKCKSIDYKIIFLKDVNLKLLQELNKLDLNYEPYNLEVINLKDDFVSNIEFKRTKSNFGIDDYSFESPKGDIKLTKFLSLKDNNLDNSGVCYYINFLQKGNNKKTLKISFNYKLKSEFFNLKQEQNKFIIKYSNNKLDDDYFYFNNKLKEYKIIKDKTNILIIFYFNLIANKLNNNFLYLINTGEDNADEINKNELIKLIYQNKLIIEKIFNFKIYIKDNKFNILFNNKLKRMIINEKINKNIEINRFILPKNIILLLTKTFNFDYKKALSIKSYFDLYKVIVNEIFGIKLKNESLYVNPNKELFGNNFKIVFLDEKFKQHGIYVEQSEKNKGLQVNETFYSNLKTVDLSLVQKNAKLCL